MAVRVSISKLCRGCMCVLENQDGSCPNCGFDKNNYPVDKKKLRVDFILKGQYLVGKSINATPYENAYIGWNINSEGVVVIKEFLPSGLAIREDYSTGGVSAASDETVELFDKAIEDYISKAKEIMSHGGKVDIIDVFRENGTAYYVMYADGDDTYRLRAFTYVNGQDIDDMIAQARAKKAMRSSGNNQRVSVYPQAEHAMPQGTAYYREPEPYIPNRTRGNISAHVVTDERYIQYRPEPSLPSLKESNREAEERERQREFEKKIEKKIEQQFEKQFEKQMEKQMNKSGNVFSFEPQQAKGYIRPGNIIRNEEEALTTEASSNIETEKVKSQAVELPKQASPEIKTDVRNSNSATIEGDRRSAYTSIPPVSAAPRTLADNGENKQTSNEYKGVINVNGRNVEMSGSKVEEAPQKKFDKTKLSEMRIAGKSLSTVAGFAICAVIIILVITTLISGGDDKKEEDKVQAHNPTATPLNTVKPTIDPNGVPITFMNGEFEAAVRRALQIPQEQIITEDYLATVEKLNISRAGVTDVSDLMYFTGLTELNVSDNKLNDINSLASLSKLKTLNIGNCKLKDISALSGLVNLEYVNLVGNSIADYTPIENVKLVNGRYCKFYFTYVYHREDKDYDGYSLWSWHSGTIGGEHEFTPVPDGSVTATVEYYVPLEEVGFKIKYKDWQEDKDVSYDRWVKLNQNRYEEQITIHVYSGEEEFEIHYSDGTVEKYGVRAGDKK